MKVISISSGRRTGRQGLGARPFAAVSSHFAGIRSIEGLKLSSEAERQLAGVESVSGKKDRAAVLRALLPFPVR